LKLRIEWGPSTVEPVGAEGAARIIKEAKIGVYIV
jgi:hypothetical protein